MSCVKSNTKYYYIISLIILPKMCNVMDYGTKNVLCNLESVTYYNL